MQNQGGGARYDADVDLGSNSSGREDAKTVTPTSNLSSPLHGIGLNYSAMALSPTNHGYGYGDGYGAWTFAAPSMPLPRLPSHAVQGHDLLSRPLPSLGVQGGSILKKSSRSAFSLGRGQTRGRLNMRFNGGGRGTKTLTKEALDADLDEWRLKDKRLAGQSLDTELDNHWSKKDDFHSDGI